MAAFARLLGASRSFGKFGGRPHHWWRVAHARRRGYTRPREDDDDMQLYSLPGETASSSSSSSSSVSSRPLPSQPSLSLSLSSLQEDEEYSKYYKRFGYTWLTHMRLAEEDSIFRQQIAEMRGRGRGWRYEVLGGSSGSGSSSGDESDDELYFGDNVEATIRAPSLESSDGLDPLSSELEWLSSQNEVIYNQIRSVTRQNTIIPLWISIHIDEDSKTASLYESVVPVEPSVVEKLEMKDTWRPFYVVRLEEEEADRNRYRAYGVEPDARVPRLTFDEYPEYTSGPWRNYFVGIWGEVAALDEGTLWPNRVLHKDRCVFNVRNGLDLVRFLADPRKKDVEDHARNLKRLANGGVEVEPLALVKEENMSSWEWGLLKSRWGSHGLKKHGFL